MAIDRTHEAENDAERARLHALVARSSDADLARPMPGGWTVAGVLAHAATWDARAIYWIDTWGPDGEPSTYAEENTEVVNASAKPLCLALRPREAAGAPQFNLARASHRKEHLDDIERVLRG